MIPTKSEIGVAAKGVISAILFLATGSVDAALIGLSTTTNSYYSIDTATGAVSWISTSDGDASLSGLAFLRGDLYATDICRPPGITCQLQTVRVNLATGTSTFVSDQGGSTNWHGLAANEREGLLYTIDLNDGNRLKSLDPVTGAITTIGATGIEGRGMDYDDARGILYATGPSDGIQSLYAINPLTGAASLIGPTGIDSFAIGIAFDDRAGVLYMSADPDNFGGGATNLYRLSIATGAATLVGSMGINMLDALSFECKPFPGGGSTGGCFPGPGPFPAPEPGTFALLGLGLAGLAFTRRRKQ